LPSSDENVAVQIPVPSLVQLPELQPTDRPSVRQALRLPNKAEAVRTISAQAQLSLNAEVLVPDEERAALAKFLVRDVLPPAAVSAAVSFVPEAPKALAPLQPIEIANLKVPSLNGEEAGRDEF
jgi:hypothetical protein